MKSGQNGIQKTFSKILLVDYSYSWQIKKTFLYYSKMTTIKKVLISGVTGQDGSNIVRFLLEHTDCLIYGGIRRVSVLNHENIDGIKNSRFKLVNLDITDQQSIINNVKTIRPDYIINFAAQSFVGESWNSPIQTFSTNTLSLIYFLEAMKEYVPNGRFYSAGSSEEMGDVDYAPQDIKHPMKPRSPYGASKCAARHLVKVYRESYNLFAIHCILFNHEGVRRGKEFVTRKISSNIARIKRELEDDQIVEPIELGNIYSSRDWSDSEDFVEAVWIMLNRDTPREYVLSSNETHTVKEFLDLTCEYAGLKVEWSIDDENPLNTKLLCKGQVIVSISEELYRPAEVELLYGDSDETRKALNWEPKTTFKQLVKKMIDHDIQLLNKRRIM
jgi:GDPmannose 4,6-dehydratase